MSRGVQSRLRFLDRWPARVSAALLLSSTVFGGCGESSGNHPDSSVAGSAGSASAGRGASGTPGNAGSGGTGSSAAGAAGTSGAVAGATSSGGTAGIGAAGAGQGGSTAGAGGGGGTASAGAAGSSGAAGAAGGPWVPSFSSLWSGTVVATPSQQLLTATGANTFRSYVRPRSAGRFKWAFWVSNGVDSTYGSGEPKPNQMGGTWTIEAAYVADAGATHSGGVSPGTSVAVTFGGSPSRVVKPGEKFWSDPVAIDLPAGHDLAFTWTLTGSGYPFVSATFLTSYKASGQSVASQESAAGFTAVDGDLVAPELFAYDHPVQERLCFLGDSITQGVGSGSNTYGYWVAKIGAGLSADIGIWNLGSGWARAADASSDGFWLYKAKQCTEVAVVLGVNDFGSSNRTASQVLADLTTIVSKLKQNNPAAKIILFTVPTFNFSGTQLSDWRQVNSSLRSSPPTGVDRVFDIAAVLSQPAPNDGLVQPQYCNGGDAHPTDVGSTAIANAFLSWYKK